MTPAVFDANVLLHAMFGTGPHEAAREALQSHQPVAPDLLAIECANAVATLVRGGVLNAGDASDVLHSMVSAVSLHVSMDHLPDALTLSLQLEHPVYDCLYAALAEKLSLPIVTADKRFAKVFAGHPFTTIVDLNA